MLGLMHLLAVPLFPVFVSCCVALLCVAFPKRTISPLSFVYLYYALWFVVAPAFASRYTADLLARPEYSLAFLCAFAGLGTCTMGCLAGEYFALKLAVRKVPTQTRFIQRLPLINGVLFCVCTGLVAAIVATSGGLLVWVQNPGDAFLNRAGSGVYVVASHFSSMVLALLCGHQAYRYQRPGILLLFIAWLAVTSPVHGSKFQLVLLLALALIPWLRDLRPMSVRTVLLGVSFVAIFVLGLYFRNLTWIEFETFLPYALNYFTALENLAISLRDFDPSWMQTFLLPFNKLLSPVGIPDQPFYFDMNHWLTDLYFPEAWKIRATEQWPVETDLYLNFQFVFGLPLLFGYLFILGAVHGHAQRQNSLGAWFATFVLTLFLVSHLRGSLINHTDFYMYPFVAAVYLLFRQVPIQRRLRTGFHRS